MLLEMKNITKHISGIKANDGIDLCLRKGEIHSLLGENGAGKTTLMNILYGLYEPDQGEIYFKEKPVKIKSPKEAIKLGIGMVHQHFMLIPAFSVLENIVLGSCSFLSFLKLKEIRKKIQDMINIYGFEVELDVPVWQLSVGEQQRIEILKTLYYGAQLLILDEPTAVLTPKETEDFFLIIKSLVHKGHSIIFITHKLKEVMSISHRVTVLRGGKKIETIYTSKTNEFELARLMVGRGITLESKKPSSIGNTVIEVKNLYALDDRNLNILKDINLKIREGEIFGIAGVDGNGQKELAEVITGMRKATGGKIIINNLNVTNLNPGEISMKRVAHIPEDRKNTGAIMNFTIGENAILGHPDFFKDFFLNYTKVKEFSDSLIKNYAIKTAGSNSPAWSLSGGNLQKLIIGRELSEKPLFIVAVHPTRGLDLGAIEYIHKMLIKECEKGVAILLISTDLNEILMLSDTVGVIYKGQIIDQFPAKETSVERIGLLMAGVM